MRFDIITIFPEIFDSYFKEGMISRAVKDGTVDIKVHNLRDYSNDRHSTVDDTPYGGGAGMVLKVEPIFKALLDIVGKEEIPCFRKNPGKVHIVLFSAKGERYNQKKAESLSEIDRIVLICGRYEGVDERVVEKMVDEEVSIGEYILTGGEIPAMVVVDSVTRLLKGVLGNEESILEESFSKEGYLEYPHYTKPEIFSPEPGNDWKVPDVLLSGHHQKIKEWKEKMSKKQAK
ncbi:MAG: tRNA (guanosine(37)-N1)-methyltransferase TrmD [Candidatus Pacebacteria bacterium]|nr:tRNA (guanosine(37)-N1)-methyltransferase TrmD [Candidatus Paceibacterota bacterium]